MAQDGTIKAIDRGTIHQIQSGQVIVDLCSVAKELVENSVDSGATAIDVRFKNQGLDAIEVQDNGSGISPENYESIALKHYTSKLSTYDDLSTLQTFGFRGEALSSLCALSNFYLTTCTQKEAPRARKLEFETSGKLKSTSMVSGKKGTTVVVENLFHNLPVRRRELERNIKREWGKVITLLNQYACIQTGVKFTVSQQPTKGKKMVLFSTKGNSTTRENIINVFGVKTISALVPMDLKLELIPTTGALGKGKGRADDSTAAEVRVQGHVSKPSHGEGRQTPDRQMFYINGRPCGLPQFAKVFNEVYRSYNTSQSPFIFADIQLDTHLYDVNVSPDKRTILLHDQGQMLDNLRESLIELFEMQDVTVPIGQTQAQKLTQTPLRTGASVSSRSSTPASAQGVKSRLPDAGRTPASRLTTSNLSKEDKGAGPDSEEEVDADGYKDEDEVDDDTQDQSSRNFHKVIPTSSSSSKLQTDNLLSRWLQKKSDSRHQLGPQGGQKDAGSDGKGKTVLENTDEDDSPEPEHSASDAQPIPSDDDQSPLSSRANEEGQTQTPEGDEDEMDVDEPPVTAIPPPSQLAASKMPGFVSASRLMKSATQEVATITIGGHSVTSFIGGPTSSKRPRLGTNESSSSSKPPGVSPIKTATRTVPVPSFGGRLSQLFSASASKRDREAGDLEIETEDVEVALSEEEHEESHEDGEGEEEEAEEDDSLFVSQPADTADNQVEDAMVTKSSDRGEDEEEQNDDEAPSETGDLQGSRENSPSIHSDHSDHDHDHNHGDGDGDGEYVDESEKKAQEDKKVQQMIDAAEAKASKITEEGEKKTQMLMKGRQKRKDATLNLVQHMQIDTSTLSKRLTAWSDHLPPLLPEKKTSSQGDEPTGNGLEVAEDVAEEKLSLKISKSDFAKMRVVGQFNMGFVLAVREKNTKTESEPTPSSSSSGTPREQQEDDELFIIDQHASDEKYHFERLQAVSTVQSQRLVQPKPLELTALEEEIIIENIPALESNGFGVEVDQSGEKPVGSRCMLTSLPLSRETTFSVADLEELIFLLGENPTTASTTSIPRPSKVRKMFASRACRSSFMIGTALSRRQMERVVTHMGEMEKPWNCPHGRPTMRHLCGLGTAWDGRTWMEGDWVPNKDVDGGSEDIMDDEGKGDQRKTRRVTDWASWIKEESGL
ncbi:mismatch repair endonuclease PMS2 [Rhypophila decipiens]|uniref:DNA mismatch repair protein PMS1 n=1 Tax=Rhypophila decipiens TaxID=261697 RepID=A0AAN7B2K8_9PEZI|nr:mismatch repair endonuclease PMS2 [Rhypophila decipiens]